MLSIFSSFNILLTTKPEALNNWVDKFQPPLVWLRWRLRAFLKTLE